MSDLPRSFEDLPVLEIPVHSLSSGYSPRTAGHDEQNVRILAQLDRPWPPILVQRQTYRVIDGTHRLLAARMRGDETISARLYDCDEEDAFVLAVRANVTHGLPLSLSDRKIAARRIVVSRPTWSDRRIALATGLSDKTVAGLRRRDAAPGESRVGSDGRSRPVDSAARRATVSRLLDANPACSLREIAERAGVSPETVRSVRAGAAQGERRRQIRVLPTRPAPGPDSRRCLQILLRDPALRSTDAGRTLLRVLSTLALLDRDPASLVDVVPEHDLSAFEELARANAEVWRSLAQLAGGRRSAVEVDRVRAAA